MSPLYRSAYVAGALVLAPIAVGLSNTESASQSREWRAPARAAATTNPVAAEEKSLATGKGIYLKECASCHGDTGKGDGPDAANLSRHPADFAAPAVGRESDGELFWKISEGRKPMPRFARMLSAQERWHLVNYIRSIAPHDKQ